MKNYVLLLSIFICLFTCACGEDDDGFSDNRPPFPEKVFIDLDMDGRADFETIQAEFIWDAWDECGDSGSGYFADLKQLDSLARLLLVDNSFYLNPGQEILINENYWRESGYYASVTQLGKKEGAQWPTSWSSVGDSALEPPYYFGLRVERNGVTTIGWIEFEFEARSGTMTVLDQNSTQEDSIVVGE